MEKSQNIYLVGLMGAGKTTIGRHLARTLGRRFADSDHEIEERTGVRIPVIFEFEGEAGFRKREAQVIEALTQERDLVLATGGGVVLNSANRNCLRESGIVIYLHVIPSILYERTRLDRNRPLLQVEDPLGRLEELYRQRDPLYREVAHIVIESGTGGAFQLIKQIEQELKKRCVV